MTAWPRQGRKFARWRDDGLKPRAGAFGPAHLVVERFGNDAGGGAVSRQASRVITWSAPAAGMAKFLGKLAVFPYFEKTRWLD